MPSLSFGPPFSVEMISRPCHSAAADHALEAFSSNSAWTSSVALDFKNSTSPVTYDEYRARISASGVSAFFSPDMIGPQHSPKVLPLLHGQVSSFFIGVPIFYQNHR